MKLRKGKTKSTLEASIDAALLAVEIYNKPRTSFRSEGYISLMIMAWLRLFHAYFNNSIGDRYYYKKNGRYEIVDGERKAWELSTCIKHYGQLPRSVDKNLQFFIGLRNKIEHRHIGKREIDILIFGECQALLYNYENLLVNIFGENYALNEALVYSLQFSHLRTARQEKANKSALSRDLSDIASYITKFRSALDDEVYNSQEYSVKLLQIPKISNTNRADAAIEFVRWDELRQEDRVAYEQIAVIIKDKKIPVNAANVKRLKTGEVIKRINELLVGRTITQNGHAVLYKLFSIRPPNGSDDPFETNTEFCIYDETHNDYVYEDAWVNFLVHFLQATSLSMDHLRRMQKEGKTLSVAKHRI
jgi:hypothetical protein